MQYFKAVLGAVKTILHVAGEEEMRPHVHQHFCKSLHFKSCMLRLVVLVGCHNPAALQDTDLAGNECAKAARDAICALCTEYRPCVDLIDAAVHPFSKSIEARLLIERMPIVDTTLQLPKRGESNPDDPFTAGDWVQTAGAVGFLLTFCRYAAWPVIRCSVTRPRQLMQFAARPILRCAAGWYDRLVLRLTLSLPKAPHLP